MTCDFLFKSPNLMIPSGPKKQHWTVVRCILLYMSFFYFGAASLNVSDFIHHHTYTKQYKI